MSHFKPKLYPWAGSLALILAVNVTWGCANAHPKQNTTSTATTTRVATSGVLPPVIESQRGSNTSFQAKHPSHGSSNPGGKMMSSSSTQFLSIQSSAFKANQPIPQQYTCDGRNISPPLRIQNVPNNAQLLALIVDDPDAPHGTFTHWLLWNISPYTNAIQEGQPPASAVEGMNDFGQVGYGGPCPPTGSHRYRFKLYALDSDLNLPQGAKVKELERAIRPHVISESILVGTYHRH